MSFLIKNLKNDTGQTSLTISNLSTEPEIEVTATPSVDLNPKWSAETGESNALHLSLDNGNLSNDLWVWMGVDANGSNVIQFSSIEAGESLELELPVGTGNELSLGFKEQDGIIIIGTADLGGDVTI